MITQSLSFLPAFPPWTELPLSPFLLNTELCPPGCVIGPFCGAFSRCMARLSPSSAAFLYHSSALRDSQSAEEVPIKQAGTYSFMLGWVPMPTSRKYPQVYIALTSPASAAFWAQRNASVSDCGKTPGDPMRYQAVSAKHASRWFCWAAMF